MNIKQMDMFSEILLMEVIRVTGGEEEKKAMKVWTDGLANIAGAIYICTCNKCSCMSVQPDVTGWAGEGVVVRRPMEAHDGRG